MSQEKVFQVRNKPNVQFWEVSQEEQEKLVNICGWEGRVLFTSPDAATPAVQASAPQQHAQAALSDEPLAYLTLGGIEDGSEPEFEDNDIVLNTKAVEALQEQLVTFQKNRRGVTIELFAILAASQQPAAAPAKKQIEQRQHERMAERFANRPQTPATTDFDLIPPPSIDDVASTLQVEEVSDSEILRRAATDAAEYLEAVATKTSRDAVWERCTSIANELRAALAAAPAVQVQVLDDELRAMLIAFEMGLGFALCHRDFADTRNAIKKLQQDFAEIHAALTKGQK